MDFDREYDLENAGIDAFDFSLMDDDERAEALRDAGLDPDDFDGIEFDSSFDAWSALQDNGLSLWELELMDDDEKKEALENAGLDPGDYESLPYIKPSPTYSSPKAAYQPTTTPAPVSNSVAPEDAPTGPENKSAVAKVISTGVYTKEAAPDPVNAESTPFKPAPDKVIENPGLTPPVQAQPVKKIGKGAWWFAAVSAIVLILVISVSRQSKPSSASYSTGSYSSYRSSGSSSYSRRYSSRPTCPPVNRELAMTREEAERLSGTGYHGTRPNSSAEITELKAAQVRCKNCGYRSHNGDNSLCDYCSWMERYGGGLPMQKAPDVTPTPTPRPTPKPTPRPTAKPQTSDPYHAGDYAHPEDFYYDYYDDFWDYEDAEEYWERYN